MAIITTRTDYTTTIGTDYLTTEPCKNFYYSTTTSGTADCSVIAKWVLDSIYDQVKDMKNNYTITGDIESLFAKDLNEFKAITEYVPNKVYGFTFYNGQEIKTVCDEEDEFNLEFAFYLAIAKKNYGKMYTIKGIMNKAEELSTIKYYNKIVKKGMKLFTKQQEEKIKAREEEEIKKAQHQKYIEKKIKQKERKRQEQINIIAKAIKKSKEEG